MRAAPRRATRHSATLTRLAHAFGRYYDKIQEGRNDMQKGRNTGRSLMNALHFTPMQPAMKHVSQAWRASEATSNPRKARSPAPSQS